MATSTFFVLSIVTIILALLIRLFWLEILVIGYVLYILGSLVFYSLILAIIWAVVVTGSSQGFGLLWLYVFLLLCSVVIVYALIVLDIANAAIDFFRKVFKV
jgi:hypothetical protein